jgi:hypothetical protein
MSTVLDTDELSDGTEAVQALIIGGSGDFDAIGNWYSGFILVCNSGPVVT